MGTEKKQEDGSSPAARGGAGVYIEGEIGAYYLLALLAGTEARGLPGTKLIRVRFQGVEHGYSMDDVVVEGSGPAGASLLEIQSKRDISFAPSDPVFVDVAAQVARSGRADVPEGQHFLAVATQRQTKAISGPYQDVLIWARAADSAGAFFARVAARGVGSDAMRSFASTFRANLVKAGVPDDDDEIWRLLRRFAILAFDFESTDPIARLHALSLARQVLSDDDAPRAGALWSVLIETSISIAKVGGAIGRDELRARLADAGFRLAGDRDHRAARARLADLSRMTLANIGTTVAGVSLTRPKPLADLNGALDEGRFVQLRGGPGVGKSGLLRMVAERAGLESQLIVLDHISTPSGGWLAFAQALGVVVTAREFLVDLAASGGALIVLDGLEMFTDAGRQRTVNDLLREAASLPGFGVVATVRTADALESGWMAEDIVTAFGGVRAVDVGELTDDEVAVLVEHAPELGALLAPGHPAASIARNLYRLSKLSRVPAAADIRTEAALAAQWWDSADNAPADQVRAGQRILADFARASLEGRSTIAMVEDSAARSHLIRSLTLAETRRDEVALYHDVLRDWAVGNLINEDHGRISGLDLTVPASPLVARGVEMAARLALELDGSCDRWACLLGRLSPPGAHPSWRRQAVLAIVRSEVASDVLERCSPRLLARGGALFVEVATTIAAVETVPTAELYAGTASPTGKPIPRRLRTNVTGSGVHLLRWAIGHQAEMPIHSLAAIVDLVQIVFQVLMFVPNTAAATARMLFSWLRQLDVRGAEVMMPADATVDPLDRDTKRRMVEELRGVALLLSGRAPEAARAYLRELTPERDTYKVRSIRPFAAALAAAAPAELADLISKSLVEERDPEQRLDRGDWRALSHGDTDYLPPSPAQPPFLDLLSASPAEGLRLVRELVDAAVEAHGRGAAPGENGFTIAFDEGPRFFPWVETYFWSRGQSNEYSVGSALMALEAWGHQRLEAGDAIEAVLSDTLGPPGSCAAYLLVAIDLLISHFPATRSAMVPFLACPDLLAAERQRAARDQLNVGGRLDYGDEPAGRVTLADLRARPSRRATLEEALTRYLGDDAPARELRVRLGSAVSRLEPYEAHSNFADPTFMGRYALNLLNPANWVEEGGGLRYRSPPEEAAHLKQLGDRHADHMHESGMDARIQLAIDGGEHATPGTARDAAAFADGGMPDDGDADSLKSRSTRLVATALLVARDGDDDLLGAHEEWVRKVIRRALEEEVDRYSGSDGQLRFNRPALAALALLHLWRRGRRTSDRNALLAVGARQDRAALPAFAAAAVMIGERDPRLLKSAMRASFAGLTWRWHSHDEDEAVQRRFEEGRAGAVRAAIAREIAWLDGGAEPAWPAFPAERPIVRSASRLRGPALKAGREEDAPDGGAAEDPVTLHVDGKAASRWLRLLNGPGGRHLDWGGEIIAAYAPWSARINGAGLSPEAEVDRSPSEWNAQFYPLFAKAVMDAASDDLDRLLAHVTELPDRSFGDVAETVVHAVDVLYFNDAAREPTRPTLIRERLGDRTMALRRWRHNYAPGDLSIDHGTGGVVARMLLNIHDPFQGARSYLVPAVVDRLDPLLGSMLRLMTSGPTAFVAMCTMNTLLVDPRARHLDFVLSAADAWFERVSSDPGVWIAMGIGGRVMDWFEAALGQDLSLLSPSHPERERIDRLLGRLVAVGIAEAHELERRIERVRADATAEAINGATR